MASPSPARADSARWRALVRLALLGAWFLFCLLPHLVMKSLGRSRWGPRFLGGVAWICGARVRRTGRPARPGELLLSNHVSWLDIPILAGATGCAFISKAELRGHWFLKWIADQNATVYVDRSERRAVAQQAAALRGALAGPQPIALFPEGTVGDGETLLPFKPALLSAVAPPPPGVTLRPAGIDYGPAFPLFRWTPGEPGLANFLRVLGQRGPIPVTVRLLDPLAPSPDRKLLARAAQAAVADALAPSGIAPPAV